MICRFDHHLTAEVVSGYKALSNVERVFRNFNTDLDIRPIRHHTENRVKAHVFLRMLSYLCQLAHERTTKNNAF